MALTVPNNDPTFLSWCSDPFSVPSPQGPSFLDTTLEQKAFTQLALSSGGMWTGLLDTEISQMTATTWVEGKVLRHVLSECGELIVYNIFFSTWTQIPKEPGTK